MIKNKKLVKKISILTLSIGLLVGSLTGCNSSKYDLNNSLVIGHNSEITSMDPLVMGGTVFKERCSMLEGLVTCDKNFKLQPNLATSWKLVNDNTWEFKLRKNVKFHDGTNLTAKAVKWCLDRVIKDGQNSIIHVADIKDIVAVNDTTLQIKTNSKNTELPACLFNPDLAIYSPTSLDDNGKFKTLIGTGPFKFDSFDESTGELVTLPFNDYWGEKPKVDALILRTYTDANTRSLALESGDINFAADVPFSEIKNLSKKDDLEVEICEGARNYMACYNMEKKPLDDVKVRDALAYGVDQNSLVDDVLNGVAATANGPFVDKMEWSDKTLKGHPYDKDKAVKLLKEAGYEDTDNDGIVDKNGKNLKLKLITFNSRPAMALIAQAMQSDYSKIGVKLDIDVLEYTAYDELRKDNKYDIDLTSATTAYIPSVSYFIEQYYGSQSNNSSHYSNKEVDKLVKQCKETENLDEKYKLSKQAQQIVEKDLPVFNIARYKTVFVKNKSVKNFVFNPASHDYIIPSNIKIEKR